MSEQVHVLSKSVGRKCERIVSIEIREDTAQPVRSLPPFSPLRSLLGGKTRSPEAK